MGARAALHVCKGIAIVVPCRTVEITAIISSQLPRLWRTIGIYNYNYAPIDAHPPAFLFMLLCMDHRGSHPFRYTAMVHLDVVGLGLQLALRCVIFL